jgi:L-fuculose-phosphate aldolase
MQNILNTKLMHPRDQIIVVISRIYNRGFTTTSGGNISIMDENGDMWVTPSAIDKGTLRASDIVCVKNDGSIEGKHKPSSEYPFHRAIYNMRPDIKALVHAHPPALVSFSIVRTVPDTMMIAQARHICGPIGYAAYELPGSEELGVLIAKEFEKGYKAIIMENHGTVVGGSDMADAFQRFETLELCAHTTLLASNIGQPKMLSEKQISEFEDLKNNQLPEMGSVSYPPSEQERRAEICRIVNRSCTQGLMISSYGTVSVRWEGNDFLITPTDQQRWELQPADIVQIKDMKREPGKKPSRSVRLHSEIYKRYPHINSIIITQPPHLMAFSITHEIIDVRTIPESWIFLRDVHNIPFGPQFNSFDEIFKRLDLDEPAVILQNDAILVTGDKLLNTFDKLEVAEFSAKSIILGARLGKMIPINDEQVEGLRRRFLS